ncbi:uncharacterized protein CCOS01_07597 [Colletotrichum costaricense]|uniref:Uncharacterized protein n=1 Tax=Colletotrichum costaricense TaxID=1209916 RepID=A0AAI9YY93_9PEZI|nr:uncharacterized protein CCOS01_07597 [Colletotrichum costaricense]KAK1527335.1 hypothetical protein CCOS01_07597 [Colletotrichum costaricense]
MAWVLCRREVPYHPPPNSLPRILFIRSVASGFGLANIRVA